MPLFIWCSQRAGGLSLLALLALCYHVLSQEWNFEPHDRHLGRPGKAGASGPGILPLSFAYYCLLIHACVFAFPLRACWALWGITRSLKRAVSGTPLESLEQDSLRRHRSHGSGASSETLMSEPMASGGHGSSSTMIETSDAEFTTYADGANTARHLVIHAIVIPNYKEEMDLLKETLHVLASHPQAACSYDVRVTEPQVPRPRRQAVADLCRQIYLGMEQRELHVESKARRLIQEFEKKFRAIDYTLHPADIPGEAAGKGSNLGWAARKLSAKYSMAARKNVIVTGIDETAATTMYSAPIIFDRNAHAVPAIVRVADILWCAAGISGLYRGSSIAPPTSVYSLPLELVDRVGGWDCGAEAIGEDLHMYLKCFFALNGNLTCRTVLSPVSQSNVTGGGQGGVRGVYVDMQARYKQALRHMWGALDTGFALRQAVAMWQERKRTSRAFGPLHRSLGDGTWPERPREPASISDVTHDTLREPHWENIVYLAHRLFEAHFLPLHMTILVFASAVYVWIADDANDVGEIGWIFALCHVLRTLSFMEVALYLVLYESFHRISVTTREREMTKAGLAGGMCFSHRSIKKNFVDYVLVPLVAPLYGAIPCAQAEISHFWTLELVYSFPIAAFRATLAEAGWISRGLAGKRDAAILDLDFTRRVVGSFTRSKDNAAGFGGPARIYFPIDSPVEEKNVKRSVDGVGRGNATHRQWGSGRSWSPLDIQC
ncbi:hypothetical protein DCS_07523 [Drechmeria coniospora]|uniref:Glycosyltransferase 2-like domain-containing protein n=1 Tax=Drechmeria coniospora TaxID=98403 RepID=A0A151GEN6_DRECN|nr:hypothetical protein DCS_07523 [Drechmeria coniospora]KYK55560.1 hypothetical protein DCS_07523 [Drechmeria coniospora]